MLYSWKLTNPADVRFVFYEENQIRSKIQTLLETLSEKAQAYMTRVDRLHFVECFRAPSIKEAYLRTQDAMARM